MSIEPLTILDASHGEVQVVCNISGSSIIAKPEDIIDALERFKRSQTNPLVVLGNGEYTSQIGESK